MFYLVEAKKILDCGGRVEDVAFSRHHQHKAIQRLTTKAKALFRRQTDLFTLTSPINILKALPEAASLPQRSWLRRGMSPGRRGPRLRRKRERRLWRQAACSGRFPWTSGSARWSSRSHSGPSSWWLEVKEIEICCQFLKTKKKK